MQGRGEKWEASNEAAVIGTVRKRREIENQKKKREEENMSLKNNKYARRLAAALMTGAMMVSMMGMTAMAQGQDGDIQVSDTMKVTKYITKDANVYAPNTTFTFTVSAAEEDEIGEKGVASAIDNDTVTVTFFPSEDGSELNNIKISQTSIDAFSFDASEFTAPGIYHYIVTEQNDSYDGMTYDTTKDLYVYVENVNPDAPTGALKIAACVMKNDEGNKTDGFTNTYTSNTGVSTLTVEKQVTGAQGNKNQFFDFSISIGEQGKENGEKYYYTLTKDGTETNGTIANGRKLNFELSDDDTLVIYGLTKDDTYTVTETEVKGYTTTVNEAAANTLTSNAVTTSKVTFVNDKGSDAPQTGVILNIAPYILMVALAGVLAFFFLRKRHYEM